MKNIVLLLLILTSLTNCNKKRELNPLYPNDTTFSNEDGFPKNVDVAGYLPIKSLNEKGFYMAPSDKNRKTLIDSMNGIEPFWLGLSDKYFYFKEPILYNFYLGKSIYRFSWFRSFDSPVIITIIKDGDSFVLKSKKMEFFNNMMEKFTKDGKGKLTHQDSLAVWLLSSPKILTDTEKTLSSIEWSTFEDKLKNCSFLKLPTIKDASGLDGSEWILEKHTSDGYKVVMRWTGDEIKLPCEYLLDLSDCNKEERY
jgi:hypothetical protein